MKLAFTLLLIPLLVLFAACGDSADDAANGEPAGNGEPAENGTVAATFSQADIDAAWQVVCDYWAAFNAYDLEGVLDCLEESYRQAREAELPGEIAQLEAAGRTLDFEEEAEPVVTADGIVVIQIELDIPVLPNRHYTSDVVQVDGVWKICGSEEL